MDPVQIFLLGFMAGGCFLGLLLLITPKASRPPRQNITPSCGCIMCDLKIPRLRSPLSNTPYHKTQHGDAVCTRS